MLWLHIATKNVLNYETDPVYNIWFPIFILCNVHGKYGSLDCSNKVLFSTNTAVQRTSLSHNPLTLRGFNVSKPTSCLHGTGQKCPWQRGVRHGGTQSAARSRRRRGGGIQQAGLMLHGVPAHEPVAFLHCEGSWLPWLCGELEGPCGTRTGQWRIPLYPIGIFSPPLPHKWPCRPVSIHLPELLTQYSSGEPGSYPGLWGKDTLHVMPVYHRANSHYTQFRHQSCNHMSLDWRKPWYLKETGLNRDRHAATLLHSEPLSHMLGALKAYIHISKSNSRFYPKWSKVLQPAFLQEWFRFYIPLSCLEP